MKSGPFSHLSGDLALDVLNTVDWRLAPARRIERLADADSVLAWYREAGLLDETEAARLGGDADRDVLVPRLHAVREEAYAMLVDRDTEAAGRIQQRYVAAVATSTLAWGQESWQWQDLDLTLETPSHRLVRALVDLSLSDRIRLLHQCEDDDCGWVYLDTSPRHNRRWCAAGDCGDRNRARAYYRRKVAGDGVS